MTAVPTCPKCAAALPLEALNAGALWPCPGCASPIRAEIFPAFFRALAPGSAGEALVVETEASCFYHAQNGPRSFARRAGRFLCALCEIELEGAHYCPSCLESAQGKGKLKSIDNQRKLYDSLAFQLALLGVLIFYFSIFTAPMALYFGLKHRKAPLSLVRRSRWRSYVAILIASLQLAGMVALVGWLLFR